MTDYESVRQARIGLILGWLRNGAWPVSGETAATAADDIAAALADRDALAERGEKLREALQELVRCDEIVKHGQHERGEKVKGGRWAKAWDRARAALKDAP